MQHGKYGVLCGVEYIRSYLCCRVCCAGLQWRVCLHDKGGETRDGGLGVQEEAEREVDHRWLRMRMYVLDTWPSIKT